VINLSNILDDILIELKKVNKNLEKINSSNYSKEGNDDIPNIMAAKDISNYLRVNISKAYELFHREDFPSLKLGNRYIIPREKFLEWLDKEIDKDKL
jgi:excisionase family DNA binding protein